MAGIKNNLFIIDKVFHLSNADTVGSPSFDLAYSFSEAQDKVYKSFLREMSVLSQFAKLCEQSTPDYDFDPDDFEIRIIVHKETAKMGLYPVTGAKPKCFIEARIK